MFRRLRTLRAAEIRSCALSLDAARRSTMFDAPSGGNVVDDDGLVARWEDQSGNAYHVTQATSANRPVFRRRAIHGAAGLEFGATRGLTRDGVQITTMFNGAATDVTVVAAVRETSPLVPGTVVQISPAANNRFGIHATWSDQAIYFDAANVNGARLWEASSHQEVTRPCVLCGRRAGVDMRLRLNGRQIWSRADASGTVSSATSPLRVGTDGNTTHAGEICAVAVYAAALSDVAKRRLEVSMMRKWRVASTRA